MPDVNTSAAFDTAFMAKVEYADGGITWHGPFLREQDAWDWLDTRLELDYEDIAEGYEGEVAPLNLVRETDEPYLQALPEATRSGQPQEE